MKDINDAEVWFKINECKKIKESIKVTSEEVVLLLKNKKNKEKNEKQNKQRREQTWNFK